MNSYWRALAILVIVIHGCSGEGTGDAPSLANSTTVVSNETKNETLVVSHNDTSFEYNLWAAINQTSDGIVPSGYSATYASHLTNGSSSESVCINSTTTLAPPSTTTKAKMSVTTTTTTQITETKEPATVPEFPKPIQRTTYFWDGKDSCWKAQITHEHILPDMPAFAPIAGTQPPMMRLVWSGDLKTPYFDNWYDFDESLASPEMWESYRSVYERMIKEYEDRFRHLEGKVLFEEFPCPCHTGVPRPPI